MKRIPPFLWFIPAGALASSLALLGMERAGQAVQIPVRPPEQSARLNETYLTCLSTVGRWFAPLSSNGPAGSSIVLAMMRESIDPAEAEMVFLAYQDWSALIYGGVPDLYQASERAATRFLSGCENEYGALVVNVGGTTPQSPTSAETAIPSSALTPGDAAQTPSEEDASLLARAAGVWTGGSRGDLIISSDGSFEWESDVGTLVPTADGFLRLESTSLEPVTIDVRNNRLLFYLGIAGHEPESGVPDFVLTRKN